MKRVPLDAKRAEELIDFLLQRLVDERQRFDDQNFQAVVGEGSLSERWASVRALMNIRQPWAVPTDFLDAQNELLKMLIADRGISDLSDTVPAPDNKRLRLWKGDITTLEVDAIVNAANSGMTGCWQPLHKCIDNAIHTFAGVQLRAECARLMVNQGHEEPVGRAKITPAYNLPSKHVIHTVGPAVRGQLKDEQANQLSDCYVSCLDAAYKAGCKTVAFCCISTGVFGFPQQYASLIAVTTVKEWMSFHPEADITVVFNVFTNEDMMLYREQLGI